MSQYKVSWQLALGRLQSGNKNFVKDKSLGDFQNSARREELLESQEPFAAILACADSRVVPEIIFDTGLGEIFVVRVAGNIASKSSIASLEYAVAKLHVKLLVVVGHENCGAITAAMGKNQVSMGRNLDYLLKYFKPSIVNCETDLVNDVVKRHAQSTVTALTNKSKILSKAVNENKLKIMSAYYHLHSGKVEFL